MSEREGYGSGKEARHGVVHDAPSGRANDHMEALLRYLKGAGHGRSTGTSRTKPLSDADIRALVVKHVTDAGGEVTAAIVAAGSVWLRGRIGHRGEIARLERDLSEIPGVTRLDLRLAYEVDDT